VKCDTLLPWSSRKPAPPARRAAVHRARLDDQVVVGPVIRIREQGLDPDTTESPHVAGDDPQLSRNGVFGGVQPLHQRTVGHLCREPGDFQRILAPPGDRSEEIDQLRQHRHPASLERPLKTER
jgi:hypothetical protein